MQYIDGNTKLYCIRDVEDEKWRINLQDNLKAILNSKYLDFITDLFEDISYADNYTESWGGTSYDKQNVLKEINRVILLNARRTEHSSYDFNCFLTECCIPVLETILKHGIIQIDGYKVNLPDDVLVGETVIIKKRVKKGYYKSEGRIINVKQVKTGSKHKYVIEFDDKPRLILTDGQFLFPEK